jgi:hypothetical protein
MTSYLRLYPRSFVLSRLTYEKMYIIYASVLELPIDYQS